MPEIPPGFSSIEDVLQRFGRLGYVADRRIATAVYLADRMQKPILVEGPAGCGKTELAKVLAGALDTELIRLQCYEGLDEAKALYEWEYPKQLLYTQILRDKIGEILHGAPTLREAVDRLARQDDAFFSERFLLQRPLLRAIRAERRVVLLIDEVDRAEAEFEAFLLEVLSDFQVSIPELGTLRAAHIPLVPVPERRLPGRRARAGDHRRPAARGLALAGAGGGARHPGPAQAGSEEEPERVRDPGVGARPDRAERGAPGPRAVPEHPEPGPQV
jgi:MoxR-like ATPase